MYVCMCVCVFMRERERERYSWEPISLIVIPRGPHARWAVLASTCVMVMMVAGRPQRWAETFEDFRIQSPERVSDLPKVTHRGNQH